METSLTLPFDSRFKISFEIEEFKMKVLADAEHKIFVFEMKDLESTVGVLKSLGEFEREK